MILRFIKIREKKIHLTGKNIHGVACSDTVNKDAG